MPSSEEDRTAVAAEQLGSMSLGESAERKAEPDTEDATKPAKLFCSSCGEEGDALKKCRACKCAWYCDKDCQNRHWKEHKKECRRIKKVLDERGGKLDLGTELDLGLPLPDLPPQEECAICMRVLPFHGKLRNHFDCCGKTICGGCNLQHLMKSNEQAVRPTCAFCREPIPQSEEGYLAQLGKRVELKDPGALYDMAIIYGYGERGFPVDQTKCIDLLRESADLGFPNAQHTLGSFHKDGLMGLQQNVEEGLKYLEAAAEVGYVYALHNLGNAEERRSNYVAAMRHWRLSASGGSKLTTNKLIRYFEHGLLHHDDLAETLRAFYRSRAELRSADRDYYMEHLKEIGEYKEVYDM